MRRAWYRSPPASISRYAAAAGNSCGITTPWLRLAPVKGSPDIPFMSDSVVGSCGRHRARRTAGLAVLALLVLWSLPGCAGGDDDPIYGGTPGYYQGTPGSGGTLSQTQEQGLTSQKNQLELQQLQLQSQQNRGLSGPILPADPTRQRTNPAVIQQQLNTNQSSIDRLNRQLAPAPAAPTFTPAPLSGTGSTAPPGFYSLGAGAPPTFH